MRALSRPPAPALLACCPRCPVARRAIRSPPTKHAAPLRRRRRPRSTSACPTSAAPALILSYSHAPAQRRAPPRLFSLLSVRPIRYDIVVCHGNVIRFMALRALQLPPEAWLRLCTFNCSLTYLVVRLTKRKLAGATKAPLRGSNGCGPPSSCVAAASKGAPTPVPALGTSWRYSLRVFFSPFRSLRSTRASPSVLPHFRCAPMAVYRCAL